MSKQDADKWADAVMTGAPSLVGQDLSSSLTLVDAFGDTPSEMIINFGLGPTIGTMSNVAGHVKGAIEAVKPETKERNINRIGRDITPYVRQADAVQQIYEDGRVRLQGPDGQEIILTPFESTMYALGFANREQTKAYEERAAKGRKSSNTGSTSSLSIPSPLSGSKFSIPSPLK